MAFQKTKIDSTLGASVHQHLLSLGIETPVVNNKLNIDNHSKIEKIEGLLKEALETLGLDLTDDSLVETPKRMAKMWVLETMWGLKPENFPKCTTVSNKFNYDALVTECNIGVMSTCEHHLITIDGFAHISYKPKDRVLGLSKLNRIVDYYSRRPQVQERLTIQIAEALKFILGTDDVAVQINAVHYCVKSRGIEDQNSYTNTSYMGGIFRTDPASRSEIMAIFNNAHLTVSK